MQIKTPHNNNFNRSVIATNNEDGRLSPSERYLGLLLGGLTGDCLGLPFEMLTAAQRKSIYGESIDHKFFTTSLTGRRGICSDDTEHLWMTAAALCEARKHDLDDFGHKLSVRLKYWILTLPIGIGKATLLSSLKLLAGFDYKKSGISSAGNGAAIRALIIGAFHSDDAELMANAIRVSTQMTHSDLKAYEGSLVIGLAAAAAMKSNLETSAPAVVFFDAVLSRIQGEELHEFLVLSKKYLTLNLSLADYLRASPAFAKGISGYINHTVAAVIYAWLRYYGDYRETITQVISAGGDTDSTAALAGALSGITVGREGIVRSWLDGAWAWPLTDRHWQTLSRALDDPGNIAVDAPKYLLFLFRNIMLMPIFGLHIIRRLVNVIIRHCWGVIF